MNNFTKFEKYAIINILSRIMKADGVIELLCCAQHNKSYVA